MRAFSYARRGLGLVRNAKDATKRPVTMDVQDTIVISARIMAQCLEQREYAGKEQEANVSLQRWRLQAQVVFWEGLSV